ncbi:DUF3055 family protein [Bacillus salipaludis]|uniref:DUF3055 family protein n=1 Tax=Bacillus salipaludis TaxID=2547811 RepID=A0A4R5VXU6_9BACI|nr:SAV0927 family protein [Bacillus salipaludis]MDQ6594915.1 DUF3055 family protein [Bacillus salipaludis]TDK64204.1 DUF3055 family protein [Bacillus salipaludis]
MLLENLLEETANHLIRYYCLASTNHRYDLVFMHSEMYFGKAMAISIQNGQMVMLNYNDISDEDYWARKLDIKEEDIEEFRNLLSLVLDKNQLLEKF